MSIESLLKEFAEKVREEAFAENPYKSGWTYQSRKEIRELRGIPAWVRLGDDDPDFINVFKEDDAKPPDAEYAEAAWKRIYNESYDFSKAVATWDDGESAAYLMPDNRVYESSYDGAEFYQYVPPRKFE